MLASPGDVGDERNAVAEAVESVNRFLEAVGRPWTVRLRRWESDVYPAADPLGSQAHVESVLDIDNCDILIGIFWKRFGAIGPSGQANTEHEIRRAYDCWTRTGRPQLMLYFSQQPYTPQTSNEAEDQASVLRFKEQLPGTVFRSDYPNPTKFAVRIVDHLTVACFKLTEPELSNEAAVADQRISCQVLSDARLVRAEGIAELMGDIRLLLHRPATRQWPEHFNLTITLNVNVTNAKTLGYSSDAVLLTDPPDPSSTPMFGRIAAVNSLAFENVAFGAFGHQEECTFRISGIRANASQMGIATIDEASDPLVFAHLSLTSTEPISVSNGLAPIGRPMLGCLIRYRGANEADVSLPVVLQSDDTDDSVSSGPAGSIHINVRFHEGYWKAFRTAAGEAAESISYRPGITNGTRFCLRFYDLPNGVQPLVTTVDLQSALAGKVHHPQACLLVGPNADGTAGAFIPDPASPTLTRTTDAIPIVPVPVAGGFGMAVWEWVSPYPRRPATVEEVTFGLVFARMPGHSPKGTIRVSAALAPISALTSSQPAGESIPRFVDAEARRSVVSFVAG